MNEAIDEKYLEGLEMTGAERQYGDGKGIWVPWTRQMVTEDILAAKEYGGVLTLVSKDGRKHVVPNETTAISEPVAIVANRNACQQAQEQGLTILPRDIPWNWTGCEDSISDGKTSCNPHMAVKKGGKRK